MAMMQNGRKKRVVGLPQPTTRRRGVLREPERVCGQCGAPLYLLAKTALVGVWRCRERCGWFEVRNWR